MDISSFLYAVPRPINESNNCTDVVGTDDPDSKPEDLPGGKCDLICNIFLGAAAGSPYIVFISTSSMLRSSDRYKYIYNTCSYA